MFAGTARVLLMCLLLGSALARAGENIDFGSVAVGSRALVHVDMAGIPGSVGVWCNETLGGPDAGEFSIVADGCGGLSLATSCSREYAFHPASPGVKNAYRTCVEPGRPQFALTGMGVAATGAGFDPNAGLPAVLPPVVRSVSPSGSASALSLSTQLKFDETLNGKSGSIFVGARVSPYATAIALTGSRTAALRKASESGAETWLINNGSSWNALGSSIPAYFSGSLNDTSALIAILNGVDTSGLCGTEFYVGYGASADTMLTNQTLGLIYTVLCNYSFSGSASGNSANFTLNATVQVATADAGKAGKFYVGRLLNGQWALLDGSEWVPYAEGALASYAIGTLSTRQISIYSNADVQALSGAVIYAGYGLDDGDLLGNGKYGAIYTIP